MEVVAIDLETTGFDPARDRIVEIGAVRCVVGPGGISVGERFATFVDPGRELPAAITRLTGITPEDLFDAPTLADALARLDAFIGQAPVAGHNVAFDLAFLEEVGFAPRESLDSVELASILLPTATSYSLQLLIADAGIATDAAHRALSDALSCAAVLGMLFDEARALSPEMLTEIAAASEALGRPTAQFFRAAVAGSFGAGWRREVPLAPNGLAPLTSQPASDMPRARLPLEGPPPAPGAGVPFTAAETLGPHGPLAASLAGWEDRPQQIELAIAIERTFESGGVLVAEAATGVGKSIAYAVPALARAAAGERVLVSTYTLPLQDQLVRRDLPALQAALGSEVAVAVLKGRGNYLCPRRWQQLRGAAVSREEVRLALKTLVWRARTTEGDRAELHLMSDEAAIWPRISADDESCTARRCVMTRGGCYLERARQRAAAAGVVVVNHALLLHDARASNTLLPESPHVIVDEAHRLEDAAVDAFGHRLEGRRLARDLERIGRSPLVIAALRDVEPRTSAAEVLRSEIARAHEVASETFASLATLLPPDGPTDRQRVTAGLRSADERWLAVELGAERLADALAGVRGAGERLGSLGGEEDDIAEIESALKELIGAQSAISHGIHQPRHAEITWLEASQGDGVSLYVAPAHIGTAVRRTLVDRHRAVVLTSATLAVAGSLTFALERFGVADIADSLLLGSPFDHASQAVLLVPDDIALPHEPDHAEQLAEAIADIALSIEGRTLVLFTSHASLREAASRLAMLEETGIAVLVQGVDGSRRAILERFAGGKAVLLGTRSFWEGVDLPGELLKCVVVARLPFDVPDDPLVEGRAERYDDPFLEYQLPQAALRLRQGVGRLIRTKTDRGAIVVLDRRLITRDYGQMLLASLPPAKLRRVPRASLGAMVAAHCERT